MWTKRKMSTGSIAFLSIGHCIVTCWPVLVGCIWRPPSGRFDCSSPQLELLHTTWARLNGDNSPEFNNDHVCTIPVIVSRLVCRLIIGTYCRQGQKREAWFLWLLTRGTLIEAKELDQIFKFIRIQVFKENVVARFQALCKAQNQ